MTPEIAITLDVRDENPTIGDVEKYLAECREHGADTGTIVNVLTASLTVNL